MSQVGQSVVDSASRVAADGRRLVVYAVPDVRGTLDAYVPVALAALRPFAGRLVVVTTGSLDFDSLRVLEGLADDVRHHEGQPFSRGLYREAVAASRAHYDAEEILLTGARWFGPREPGLASVFAASTASDAPLWELVEQSGVVVRDFSLQGFPLRDEPYLWTLVRGALLVADLWGADDARPLAPRAAAAGHATDAMFTSAQFGSADPAVLGVHRLIAAGIPVLPRDPFVQYPPFLEQHAVIGREIIRSAARGGFDIDPVLAALVRAVPPKALNTNLGMLEIITPAPAVEPSTQRVLAFVHVTDLDAAPEALRRIDFLPAGYDIVVTTTDGSRAARLERLLREPGRYHFARAEVRVSPTSRGRDMSDLFLVTRDLILDGGYDIIVKVRCRSMSGKTRIVRSYFRRYQLENLLASDAHVSRVLEIFRREEGLGLVFPPMIHIGYQTMGRAWGPYREGALRLAQRLGVTVPLDRVSPLAPFGGMFFARPAALARMAREQWTYRDYGHVGDRRYRDLARVQERMLTAVAAQSGFHSRTVLTPEHAAISHTALEFKADEISATTRGYPVDRIQMLNGAGPSGRGGIVGLTRMYLRLNHPGASLVLLPLMQAGERCFLSAKSSAAKVRARRATREMKRADR